MRAVDARRMLVDAKQLSAGPGSPAAGSRRSRLQQLVFRPDTALGPAEPTRGRGRARLDDALGEEFAGFLISVLGVR